MILIDLTCERKHRWAADNDYWTNEYLTKDVFLEATYQRCIRDFLSICENLNEQKKVTGYIRREPSGRYRLKARLQWSDDMCGGYSYY